jgi:phosphoserine phosphatase
MRKKPVPLAIAYDFDGTLAPGNMQEHSFLPEIGMGKKAFWGEVERLCREHKADNILVYMGLMLEKAQAAHVRVRRSDWKKKGKKLRLFEGVEEWFDRIRVYGRESGVHVTHYIISSGLREIVEGSVIGEEFEAIFASTFWYDHNGVAKWPALALNYTTKTQYLFRINKGCLDVYDHSKINEYVPKSERPIPFENMVYIGDGETDIPCFRLLKDLGGHSIAVFRPHTRRAKQISRKLVKDGRVNFVAPADYRDKKELDRIVKAIIDKVAHDHHLRRLHRQTLQIFAPEGA